MIRQIEFPGETLFASVAPERILLGVPALKVGNKIGVPVKCNIAKPASLNDQTQVVIVLGAVLSLYLLFLHFGLPVVTVVSKNVFQK